MNARNIIIVLQDMPTKNTILREARNMKSSKFMESEVQIFPDLSAEALQIRWVLRPITDKRNDAGIRYQWNQIQMDICKALRAFDVEEGQALLQAVGLSSPTELMDISVKGQKRKLESPSTPFCWNKVSNRLSSP